MHRRSAGTLIFLSLCCTAPLDRSAACAQDVPEYRWTSVTDRAAYAPRDGAGALVFQDKMWLLGGWNPGDKEHFPRICNNEVWSSTNGADWTLVKPNTFLDRNFDPLADWEGRHTVGYVVYREKMWIVGGDVSRRHFHQSIPLTVSTSSTTVL